jgi:hypothetical protein
VVARSHDVGRSHDRVAAREVLQHPQAWWWRVVSG